MEPERRKRRTVARVVIDAAMAAMYVAVMATALVQEAPHEYLGVALFVVTVAHAVLNLRWFKALFRGRYSAVRTMRLIAIAGLLVCMVGMVASSLVISKHAFGFLPAPPGTGWARRMHMLCSYWGFVFTFAHAGLQLKGFGRLVRPACARHEASAPAYATGAMHAAIGAVSCFGAYSFIQAGIPSYLLGQVQFAYVDFSEPLVMAFVRWVSIAVLISVLFYYAGLAAGAIHKRKRRRASAS